MTESLVNMKPGEEGVVKDIQGGCGSAERIQSMGVRTGKRLKKIGGRPRGGPQTVLVDNFKVAIGFGMAEKILVEVEKKSL